MTNEQKVEAYRMRLDGATLQQVADIFGVTKEYIRQITPAGQRSRYRSADERYAHCVYPAIAQWMHDNRFSYKRLANEIGVAPATLYGGLSGARHVAKYTIDGVLAVTGMTYEEAFAKKEEA